MVKTNFRIDLGQGDTMDITVERESEYGLFDFLNEIENAEFWFVMGDAAIQKSYIKRVVLLEG